MIVSTAQKAKGREFATFVVLDDFDLPSKLAKRRCKDPAQIHEIDELIDPLHVACTGATDRFYLLQALFEELCRKGSEDIKMKIELRNLETSLPTEGELVEYQAEL